MKSLILAAVLAVSGLAFAQGDAATDKKVHAECAKKHKGDKKAIDECVKAGGEAKK